jgi:hypothetical protein
MSKTPFMIKTSVPTVRFSAPLGAWISQAFGRGSSVILGFELDLGKECEMQGLYTGRCSRPESCSQSSSPIEMTGRKETLCGDFPVFEHHPTFTFARGIEDGRMRRPAD